MSFSKIDVCNSAEDWPTNVKKDEILNQTVVQSNEHSFVSLNGAYDTIARGSFSLHYLTLFTPQ